MTKCWFYEIRGGGFVKISDLKGIKGCKGDLSDDVLKGERGLRGIIGEKGEPGITMPDYTIENGEVLRTPSFLYSDKFISYNFYSNFGL